MKELELNLTTVVVLLVFIFTVFVDLDSPASKQEFVIDKARSEGFVAFIVNEKSFDSEEVMFKMNANVMARKNLSTETAIKRRVPAQKVQKDVNADPPNL